MNEFSNGDPECNQFLLSSSAEKQVYEQLKRMTTFLERQKGIL